MCSKSGITIVIVNYNTTDHLINCLDSISKYFLNTEIEIIVIDNCSTEKQITILPNEYPNVKFYFRDINDGFGSGCNFGMQKSSGDYLLFINPDIIIKDKFILKLKEFLQKNNNCGIVSGVMVDCKNSPIYFFNDFPSYIWEFYQMIGFGYDSKINKLITRKEIEENKNFEVDWFHGAFFMIRKDDFEKIGGFNERYFMYYEDVDLCYKAKYLLKKKNVCIPGVKVFHHTQSSIEKEDSDDIFIFHLNRGKILFMKNYFFLKRYLLYAMGIINISLRIIILPFWGKYKRKKNQKLKQLLKILKLYFSSKYLLSSKFEYIK